MKIKLSQKIAPRTRIHLASNLKFIAGASALSIFTGTIIYIIITSMTSEYLKAESNASAMLKGDKNTALNTGGVRTTKEEKTANYNNIISDINIVKEESLNINTTKHQDEIIMTEYNNESNLITKNIGSLSKYDDLLQFDAELNNRNVELKWSFKSQANNIFFTIERSEDGENFNSLGTVKDSDDSYVNGEYSFIDKNPAIGLNYYRLKQTNSYGNSKYFKMITVNMLKRESKVGTVTTGPNPFTDEINVYYISPTDGLVEIVLLDMSGRIVKSTLAQVTKGSNTLSVSDNLELPSGMYMLGISSGNKMTALIKMLKDE